MEETQVLSGMEAQAEVDQEIVRWLTGVPFGDINFSTNLAKANAATIRAALAQIGGKEGQKAVEMALRGRLKKILQDSVEAASATNEQLNRTQALEVGTLQAEHEQEKLRAAAQTEKEQLIGQCYQAIGQVQASNMFAKFATVSSLVWLRDVKANKIYRDIPGVGTWDKFCDSVGMSRQKVDLDLLNLAAFGEGFLMTCQQLSVGYRELRKLRQLTHDGAVTIDGECLRIGEETIPINEDHAEDLQAAIEKIIEEKATITKRVEKLEKGVAEVVKEETKSLKAEKDALVKEVKRLKPFDPEEKDRSFCAEQMEEIREITMQAVVAMSKFIVREDVAEDPAIMGQVEGQIQTLELCLQDLHKRWEEKVQLFES